MYGDGGNRTPICKGSHNSIVFKGFNLLSKTLDYGFDYGLEKCITEARLFIVNKKFFRFWLI